MKQKEFYVLKKIKSKLYPKLLATTTDGKHIDFTINAGGDSFAYPGRITLGYPEYMFEDEPQWHKCYDIIYSRTQVKFNLAQSSCFSDGLFWHERGHQRYTNFKKMVKLNDWAINTFSYLKTSISANMQDDFNMIVGKICHSIFNGIEDGRVETLTKFEFPLVSTKYLRYIHLIDWKIGNEKNKSNLVNLTLALANIGTMNVYPSYFLDLDQELQDNIKNVYSDVRTYINTADIDQSIDIAKLIIKKLQKYIEKLILEELEDTEKKKQIMSMLKDMFDFQDTQGNSIPKNFPSSEQSKSTTSSNKNGKNSKDGKDGKDDEDNKNVKDGKNDDKDKKNKKDGKGNKNKEEEKNGGKEKNKRSLDHTEFAKQKQESENDDNNRNEDNNVTGTSDGSGEADNSPDEISGVIDDLKKSIDDEINSIENDEGNYVSQASKTIADEEKKSDFPSQMDIAQIKKGYPTNDTRTDFEVVEQWKSIKTKLAPPTEIVLLGRKLRAQLIHYFKNQQVYDETNQRHGKLNKSKLYKIPNNDSRIFFTKGKPYNVDTAIEIVWDNSGSMCGDKQNKSALACAVIEEALKGIVPLRIFGFATSGRSVKHYNIKNFDDNNCKINYAYSYSCSRQFNEGNKDGYSINVATQELLKRSENTKLMFVLSDGLPSDYINTQYALNDVKTAVKKARQNNIIVVPIFFGRKSFREKEQESYEFMYEKDLISCESAKIMDNLVKIVKKVLLRG